MIGPGGEARIAMGSLRRANSPLWNGATPRTLYGKCPFRDAVTELTGGQGVDVVMDVVGGDLMTDSLRSLGTQGRLLVVGGD